MQNHKSLAHALQGEAKREYNKKYYAKNPEYWVEWREKNQKTGHVGAGSVGSWDNSPNTHGGAGSVGSWNVSSGMKDIKRALTARKEAKRKGQELERYYKSLRGASYDGPAAGSGHARDAMARKIEEVEEKQRLEQEKRIRIRNRIASVYKLEWAEAQERAKRLPNRIVNGIKNSISNIASTVVSAIKLGKK